MIEMLVLSVNLWSLKPLEQRFIFKDRPACVKALKRVRSTNYRILKKECK